MKKIIETEVMTFEELSEKAKEKARQWWLEGGLEGWCKSIEDDAKEIGLNLTSFDFDSASFVCRVELEFINGGNATADKILHNHGEGTDAYNAAIAFEKAKDAMPELPPEDDKAYYIMERYACAMFDALEGDFLMALTDCYKKLLQQEFDYRCSNECVDANILANEYTFTGDGKRFG